MHVCVCVCPCVYSSFCHSLNADCRTNILVTNVLPNDTSIILNTNADPEWFRFHLPRSYAHALTICLCVSVLIPLSHVICYDSMSHVDSHIVKEFCWVRCMHMSYVYGTKAHVTFYFLHNGVVAGASWSLPALFSHHLWREHCGGDWEG
jgi:hypothetical protein